MRVETTGGRVHAVELVEDPEMLVVRGDAASLRSMLDAIELAGNAEGVAYPVRIEGDAVLVPRPTFALWLQFEALNDDMPGDAE